MSYMVAEYRCPEHGVFADLVERPSPANVPCPQCGGLAEWTISAPPVHTQFVVSATQGKPAPKPHRNSMDTRAIGEGQTYTEWRKERKRIWNEERHKRVRRLLE